jgi:uncharacterized membrane protein
VAEEVVGTFIGRWYVTIFGVVFLVVALRHLGLKRTAIYTAIALAVGVLAENGSVHLGIPYTRYAFNPELRGHELWVGDVPLMVPLSYTFMAYFAFAAARLIVAGPYFSRSRQPVLEYVMAVVLATWALWIIDPVSRLGRYFVLGELFRYDGPGFWFGLPLGSQVGFLCTSGVLIGVLTWMMRDEPVVVVPHLRNHPRLPAFVTYLGQVGFMGGTAFVVARTTGDSAVAVIADALAGATLIVGIPMALLTAVHWRSLRSVVDARPSHGSDSTGRAGREIRGESL